jgi:hypothetical protein
MTYGLLHMRAITPDRAPTRSSRKEAATLDQPDDINESGLVLATPRRHRNREHLRYSVSAAANNPIRIIFMSKSI